MSCIGVRLCWNKHERHGRRRIHPRNRLVRISSKSRQLRFSFSSFRCSRHRSRRSKIRLRSSCGSIRESLINTLFSPPLHSCACRPVLLPFTPLPNLDRLLRVLFWSNVHYITWASRYPASSMKDYWSLPALRRYFLDILGRTILIQCLYYLGNNVHVHL